MISQPDAVVHLIGAAAAPLTEPGECLMTIIEASPCRPDTIVERVQGCAAPATVNAPLGIPREAVGDYALCWAAEHARTSVTLRP